MLFMTTHRPRNVSTARAAGILYGDWGTSKAYVIGIAFAFAGYGSFWPIVAVSILSLLVGINYAIICKYYPEGGGVYASVRRRSKWLALIGAFFLVADYLVTAALSALAAFHYFGVADPVLYAGICILVLGLCNYFGPKHTGSFALFVAIAAVAVFTTLAICSLFFIQEGWHNLAPITQDPIHFWTSFCAVIVALSGVETIANTTSVMTLNRGATYQRPVVTQTSTPAILIVMTEVILYTLIFSLAASAIPDFHVSHHIVSAPGFMNVSDYMLSYLALVFGSKLIGPTFGWIFSSILKGVVGLILLSAVNTAMNGLISLQYIMASDGELPRGFRKTNSFGVPVLPLLCVSILPALLILMFKQVIVLASLYAIGFVGAITANLGATSTDRTIPLSRAERILMCSVGSIMALIEISLFIQKPEARYFVLTVLIIGLALRWLTKPEPKPITMPSTQPSLAIDEPKGGILCVVKRMGQALPRAIQEAKMQQSHLHLVFVRELRVLADADLQDPASKDPVAQHVFTYAQEHGDLRYMTLHYRISDSYTDLALEYVSRLEVTHMIVDRPMSKALHLIHGNSISRLQQKLPKGIALIIA